MCAGGASKNVGVEVDIRFVHRHEWVSFQYSKANSGSKPGLLCPRFIFSRGFVPPHTKSNPGRQCGVEM